MVEYIQPPDPGGDVVLAQYDPAWPALFEQLRDRIVGALGAHAIEVHHAGSTSVPGLAAKPIVDVVLVVADATDEPAYVRPLEDAGFALHAREPEWWEHRILKSTSPRVNLHVFGAGCPEVTRMLAFRDHLRRDESDRALYERVKRDLAKRRWDRVQDYADAKTDVVAEIMSRAMG